MNRTSPSREFTELSIETLEDGVRRPCECAHPDAPTGGCRREAAVRVTLVCTEEGCDSAAGVYLICHPCLLSWKRSARRDGLRLRVQPL
jgi:hypothetical protein